MSDLKFRGYAIKDEKNWTQFELIDFKQACLLDAGLPRSSKLTYVHQQADGMEGRPDRHRSPVLWSKS